MSAWQHALLTVLLACLVGCADFTREEQQFCERNPERCGQQSPPDGGSQLCGNNYLDTVKGEVCDDGNTLTETECPYGTPRCTLCNDTCTQSLSLTGRYCGDGALNDSSEECDDGNNSDEDDCPTNCKPSRCGDGYTDRKAPGVETCDDGNIITETECPYGTPTCNRCDSSCSNSLSLTGPYCGDGTRNGNEGCDDGNTITETACPYGQASCTVCDASCSASLSLTGPYCGDGTTNGPEACDDGNSDACGTCSSTCLVPQFAKATGSITTLAPSQLNDTDEFYLRDALHSKVTFRFDTNGTVPSGTIPVDIAAASTAADVAVAIANAINGVTDALDITATASGNVVNLVHDQEGSLANNPIQESVTNTGFKVSGMSGGAGYDCPSGTPCATSQACEPALVCLPNNTCGSP